MSSTPFSHSTNKPLHVGIDANEANVEKRVGSNWYAYELIKAIYRYQQNQDKVPYRFTLYLKNPPLSDMPREIKGVWQYRLLTPRKAWTQWRLPLSLYLNPDRPKVFFSPGHYSPRFSPIPTIATILDLAYLEYPNLFLRGQRGYLQLKTWTDYSVKQASWLLTISENSRRDIVKHYHYPQDKITVVYPGIDLTRYNPESPVTVKTVLAKYGLSTPYLLYVGTIQPRKNLNRLIDAFAALPLKFKKYRLVIAGSRGWLTEAFDRHLATNPARERILITGYVDPADLPALYTGAACSLLVGLYEGFGIPPAESLACGTIPVVSNNSSLPEVVGQSGVLVDPFSVKSITGGIIRAVSLTQAKRQLLVSTGQEHISQFTWDKAANLTLKAIYDVALSG